MNEENSTIENILQDTTSSENDTSNTSTTSSSQNIEETILILNNKISELQDKLLRAQADFANLKQRSEKEKSELFSYATESYSKGLISLLDILVQGLLHIPANVQAEPWAQGFFQYEKAMRKFLEEKGVKTIAIMPNETLFDPQLHEAISTGGEGTEIITEVYQEGFTIHDKTLRPAKVKVA